MTPEDTMNDDLRPDDTAAAGRPEQADPRSASRRFGEIPFLLVLAGVALGLTVVGLHHFKRGAALMAAALVVGAVLRLVLPEGRSGLLAVRSRAFDVMTLAGLGVAVIVVAALVPPPS